MEKKYKGIRKEKRSEIEMTARIFATTLRRINFHSCAAQYSFTKVPGQKQLSISVFLPQSSIHSSSFVFQEKKSSERLKSEAGDDKEIGNYDNISDDPKDRSRVIPLETSMSYLESDAYRRTYGDHKVSTYCNLKFNLEIFFLQVWELYRRNFANGRLFAQTRKQCIRNERISTGNPCPICRDEYLVVDHRNLKLITQFIDEYSGRVYNTRKTGVCRTQHLKLLVAIEKARELGILTIDQPFVEYDYSKYNPRLKNQ